MSSEREEAAERLREWHPFEPGEERCFVNAWQSLGRTVGATPGEEIAWRIADLIDPTCEFVPIGDDRFGCSECGVTVRLDLDVPTFDDMAMPFRYCPSCGARVVRGDD